MTQIINDSVIIHLEIPDILECKVKWALGSITTNKTSGGDRIPVELFQILKDDAVKVLHSICQELSSWPYIKLYIYADIYYPALGTTASEIYYKPETNQ